MQVAFKPLLRIVITFALVWFYHALATPYVGGWPRVAVVVVLAVPTWVVVSRVLFGDPLAWPWDPRG